MKRSARLSALCLSLLLLVPLAGCSASRTLHASPRASRVVATVGGTEVRYEEVYYLAKNAGADDETLTAAERRAFVEKNLLSRERALAVLGEEYGISVDKGEIAESVGAAVADMIETEFGGDRDAYAESLDAAFLTDGFARFEIGATEYLPTAIVKAMIESGEIDDSDEAARALIESDGFIRTVQVYISKTNGYSEEENAAHAEEIRREVAGKATAPERYAAMRSAIGGKYNNDYADTLGNGYYFARGEMSPAYEAVAFALEEYGVGEVLETADGYYVVMRLPKDGAYMEANFQTLKEQAYFILLNDRVDAVLDGMEVSWTAAGERLDFDALPAITADGGEWLLVAVPLAAGVLILGAGACFFLFRKRKVGAEKPAGNQISHPKKHH